MTPYRDSIPVEDLFADDLALEGRAKDDLRFDFVETPANVDCRQAFVIAADDLREDRLVALFVDITV